MVGEMRHTYTAEVELSGGWWSITIPELHGVFSQAKRLDRVEYMARDAISLWLEVAPDSFDIVVKEVLDPSTEASIRAADRARRTAADAQHEASITLRSAARLLREQGLPQRDIGRLLKLSHQRVAQLLAEPRKRAATPSE